MSAVRRPGADPGHGAFRSLLPLAGAAVLAASACGGTAGGSGERVEPPPPDATPDRDASVARSLPDELRPGEAAPVTLSVRHAVDVGGEGLLVRESPPAGWVVIDVRGAGRFDPGDGVVEWKLADAGERDVGYRVRPPLEARGTHRFAGRIEGGGLSGTVEGDRSVDVAGRPVLDGAAGAAAGPEMPPVEVGHGALAPFGPPALLPAAAAPASIDGGGTRGSMAVATPGQLPPAKVGRRYAQPLEADGGRPPFVWTLEEGWLPPGLRLDRERGAIVGTPEEAGLFDLTVSVRDPRGRAAGKAFVLTVRPAVAAILVAGTEREHDGSPKAVSVRTDPPGLEVEIDYEGREGPPTAPGEYPVSVEVTGDAYRGSTRAVLRIDGGDDATGGGG